MAEATKSTPAAVTVSDSWRVAGGGPPVQPVRYDADQTVAAFAARLPGAVDLDAVRADLLTVVGRDKIQAVHVIADPRQLGFLSAQLG